MKLLHVFSSFNHCYGCEDNMFYSEFTELLLSLFPSLTLSSRHYDLFAALSREPSPRIDRFELLYILSFFCTDLSMPNNAEILFELLLMSSDVSDCITSFDRFVRAVLTVVGLVLPRLLVHLQQDKEVLVFRISKQLFDACSNGQQVSSISKTMFMENAKKSFRLDEIIRYGRSLFDDRVELLQQLFGVQLKTLEDISCVMNCTCKDEALSIEEFRDVGILWFYHLDDGESFPSSSTISVVSITQS